MNMGLFFIIFLAVLLLNGSVAFSMLFCSGIYFLVEGLSFMLVAQRLVAGANQFVLLAIPFFILASNIMNYGGVTDRIFNFANKAVGHIPGGLGHANILASVIFAGMSGSAVADCAGLGKIEIKAMKDAGYDEGFAAAITGASSIIGPIIPPSIPCVLYGVAASVSIGQLFLGGAIPGVIMAVCLAVMVTIEALRNGYPREKWEGFRVLFKTLGRSFLSLLTPCYHTFRNLYGFRDTDRVGSDRNPLFPCTRVHLQTDDDKAVQGSTDRDCTYDDSNDVHTLCSPGVRMDHGKRTDPAVGADVLRDVHTFQVGGPDRSQHLPSDRRMLHGGRCGVDNPRSRAFADHDILRCRSRALWNHNGSQPDDRSYNAACRHMPVYPAVDHIPYFRNDRQEDIPVSDGPDHLAFHRFIRAGNGYMASEPCVRLGGCHE